MVEIVVGAAVVGMGTYLGRLLLLPACPRCKSRRWDRKLCAPLLFCRRCATRVDFQGRTYT